METGHPFDLETAVGNWRARYAANSNFWPADLDELEANLRDRFEAFRMSGNSEQVAFDKAVDAVGSPDELEQEYRDGRLANTLRGTAKKLTFRVFPPLVVNYFQTATRSMKRAGLQTLISSIGLAVAFACCIWIIIFVFDELGYDTFPEYHADIVRLTNGSHANTPEYWAPAITENIPGIRDFVRIGNQAFEQTIFEFNNTLLPETNGIYADASLFEVFSWKLEQGEASTALVRPFTIVISRDLINRYGLPENPIGSVVEISGLSNAPEKRAYEITGVLAAPSGQSHISFDYVLSMESILFLEERGDWGTPFSWTNRMIKTYFLLEPAYDREQLASGIGPYLRSHISDEKYSLDEIELQSITDIHLRSGKRAEFPGGGNLKYVYLLATLALLVLILAIVNFVNLATSRSLQRAKEVGMRKAMGATRGQIWWQYVTESAVVVFLSLLVAFVFAFAMEGFVDHMTMRDLSLKAALHPVIMLTVLGVTLLTAFAAGFYPAVTLSRFESVDALKPGTGSVTQMSLLRRGLVVLQFAASIGLIITTLVMQSQMRYIENRPLGYDPEGVFVINFGHSTAISDNLESVLTRLRSDPRVVSVSAVHSLPTSFLNSFPYYAEGQSEYVQLGNLALDAYLMDVLRIDPVAGRTFIPDQASDSLAFVVNETAGRELGWTPDESILGKTVEWRLGNLGFAAPIIGVIPDFHYNSLHNEIEPVIFNLSRFGSSNLLVRVEPTAAQGVIAAVENIWKSIEHDYPFNYSWMRDRLDAQYVEESRLLNLFTRTAGIALVIACLGLFSLASFETKRRVKEIGIRKVLGAGSLTIAKSFTLEFTYFILVATLVAGPVAFLAMRRWLESFAYRTDIGPLPVIVALLLTACVALASVSYQTIKAATANPTESLRS